MEDFAKLAFTRRSIRKFDDKDIPIEDVEQIIRIAVSAPSGCNSQCWRFLAVTDKKIIKKMEAAVIEETEKILEISKKKISSKYLETKRKMVGFFAKAPVVIAVFMTKIDFYDSILVSALKDHGYNEEDMMKLYSNYDLLSIGAAIQNLLLAVHDKGYGACCMNEPAIASERINEILKIPPGQRFISLIPIGIPAQTPGNKKMKDFSDVFSIL